MSQAVTEAAERLLLRIPEAQARLGVQRTTIYELVAAGELRIVKIGRAARIPVEDVQAYYERLLKEA